jgi:hypothetical protein
MGFGYCGIQPTGSESYGHLKGAEKHIACVPAKG